MIAISSVANADVTLYDEVWIITNTTPRMPIGAIHHPELAPDKDKFIAYKKGDISIDDLLNSYREDLYSGKYDVAINKLVETAQTKWIQCCCYCDDWLQCHRGVLFTYLRDRNIEVLLM